MHEVAHVQKIGWDRLNNGELIAAAELESYAVLVTADKTYSISRAQKGRKISIVVLKPRYDDFQGTAPLVPQILAALDSLPEGSLITINPDSHG